MENGISTLIAPSSTWRSSPVMRGRQMRHRRHGVIEDQEPVQMDLETEVHTRIAAQPEGMKIGEIVAAFSKVSRPTLYRVLNNLTETHRLTRTGKPRTPDVRYLSVSQ